MKALSHVAPSALLMLLRDAPISSGKVGFAWRVAVGAAVERSTYVRLEGRVLIVDATSPQWSREIRRSSNVILQRLQDFLGAEAIERIEVRGA